MGRVLRRFVVAAVEAMLSLGGIWAFLIEVMGLRKQLDELTSGREWMILVGIGGYAFFDAMVYDAERFHSEKRFNSARADARAKGPKRRK